MSDKPNERKSGWYVVIYEGEEQIAQYRNSGGFWSCTYEEFSVPESAITVINETEIFDQLKQAEEMREKIEEAKEIIKGLNVIIHALTHTDCPMLERKDIEDVVWAAKQFI